MEDLITIKEASEILGLTQARVGQMCKGFKTKGGLYYYPPIFENEKDFFVIGGKRNKIYLKKQSVINYLEMK